MPPFPFIQVSFVSFSFILIYLLYVLCLFSFWFGVKETDSKRDSKSEDEVVWVERQGGIMRSYGRKSILNTKGKINIFSPLQTSERKVYSCYQWFQAGYYRTHFKFWVVVNYPSIGSAIGEHEQSFPIQQRHLSERHFLTGCRMKADHFQNLCDTNYNEIRLKKYEKVLSHL